MNLALYAVLLVLAVVVVLIAVGGERELRALRDAEARHAKAIRDIEAELRFLSRQVRTHNEEIEAHRREAQGVKAGLEQLRRKADDTRALSQQRSDVTDRRLVDVAGQADGLHHAVGKLEQVGRHHDRTLRHIILAVTALSDRDPAVTVELFARKAS